uniref:Uncharacterized protein n=1 Tax=Oryza brachyantha TaxID=4533 RepID=J3KYE4_ORYBR
MVKRIITLPGATYRLGDAAHGALDLEHSRDLGEEYGLFMLRPSMDAPRCLFYDRRKLAATTPTTQLPTATMHDLHSPAAWSRRGHAALQRAPVAILSSIPPSCEIDGNPQAAASSAREQLGELERLKKKRPVVDEP